MKNILPYILAVFSGLIVVASWLGWIPGLFALTAYIPLLFSERLIADKKSGKSGLRVFIAAFICFFLVNILGMWWLQKLVSFWALILYLINSLSLAVVFLLFSVVRRKLGNRLGYVSFIFFTLTFEFITLHVDFFAPCMINGAYIFGAGNNLIVQWYEYTGILGGSLWVLLSNVSLFAAIRKFIETKSWRAISKPLIFSAITIVAPVILSLIIYSVYEEEYNPVEVVIVQPNIDPFNEKFSRSKEEQLDIMLGLAQKSTTESTDYILFPETALDSNIWLNNITENYLILKIRDFLLNNYPHTNVITGADMMQYYVVKDGVLPTPNAKKTEDDRVYFDFFNVAIQIDSNGEAQVYKKSKLVLGTEYIPFSHQFPKLQKWVINLGGSAQSRGKQEKPSLLTSQSASVVTVICYESLFGGYITEFVKLGGEVIFVLTNDGWWDGTSAPRQHFRFSQIRAIETRRSVARCGNTGISGYIDQKGNIRQKTEWWVAESLNNTINKNDKITFYTKHGDYIGQISLVFSIIILLYFLFKVLIRKKRTSIH